MFCDRGKARRKAPVHVEQDRIVSRHEMQLLWREFPCRNHMRRRLPYRSVAGALRENNFGNQPSYLVHLVVGIVLRRSIPSLGRLCACPMNSLGHTAAEGAAAAARLELGETPWSSDPHWTI